MPRPATPVPNNPKWAPREFSRLRSARDRGSPGTNWKPQQEYAAQINSLTEFCKVIWHEISKIRESKSTRLDMHPFRIYTVNPSFRYAVDTSGSFWRTVKVRGGCVLTEKVSTGSIVWGTDMNNYPDNSDYPNPVNKYDIEVPASQSQYWFWIETHSASLGAGTGSYILRYASDPKVDGPANPIPWDTFPSASATHIPIGFCDTLTSGSRNQLITRQYQRTDVVSTGGSAPSLLVNICNDQTGVAEQWLIVGTKVSSSV
jgi:hypothetical protein